MIHVSWIMYLNAKNYSYFISRWRWFPRYTYSLVFFTLFITKSIITLLEFWCFQKNWKLVKLRSFVYKQTHIRRRRSKKATNIFKNRHIWKKTYETPMITLCLFCLHIYFVLIFKIFLQGGFIKEATTVWNCGKNVISCYQNIVFLITNRPMTKKLQAPFCCHLIESAPFRKKMASHENLHSKPSITICELTFSPPIHNLTWSSGWMH